jgi:FkbM family methyltransferase
MNSIQHHSTKFCMVLLGMMSSNLYALNFKKVDDMFKYIRLLLPEAPLILESGGHYGEDTAKMAALWPHGTIYVFEPLITSYKKIGIKTRHLNNVRRYNYALSDYVGVVPFYLNPGNDGACSIGSPVAFNEREFVKVPIQVPCTTINMWATEHAIDHIDFMWLDMEGHELTALKEGTLLIDTVKVIYTEVNFDKVRQTSCLYVDLRAFLEEHGFKEVWKERYIHQGNALFIRP